MLSSTERKASGLDLVARDKPSDNLMLKSGAGWLQPSLPWARARAEKGAGTLRRASVPWARPGRRRELKPFDGSGRRRFDQ